MPRTEWIICTALAIGAFLFATYHAHCGFHRLVPCAGVAMLVDPPQTRPYGASVKTVVLTAQARTPFVDKQLHAWKVLNPNHTVVFFDDVDATAYLSEHYPWAARMFKRVAGPIKADLFRTLYLAKQGGCYSDVDVVPLVAIQDFDLRMPTLWVPTSFHRNQLNPTVIVARANDPVLLAAVDVYKFVSQLPLLERMYWDLSVVSIYGMLQSKGWHIDSRAKEIIPKLNGRRQYYKGYVARSDGTRLFLIRSPGWDMARHGETAGQS